MTDNTINSELEQLYKNDFQSKTEVGFEDYDRTKIWREMCKKGKFVNILEELMNVYTLGKIYAKDNETYKMISLLLKQFGLEKYKNDLINLINSKGRYSCNSVGESCYLLSNTSNAPIRKLNHEYPDDEDANRIMALGSYVLKKFKVSNFDELRAKLN